MDYYVSIPRTFGMLSHWIVAFVSRALLGLPIIRLLHYLLHKLRCFTGISGPEKSRKNTREKISYLVLVANQLLTRHSPLAPLGQVDE